MEPGAVTLSSQGTRQRVTDKFPFDRLWFLGQLRATRRMVGAMSLGQSIHDLETRLERARRQPDAGLEIVDELETALDQTRQTWLFLRMSSTYSTRSSLLTLFCRIILPRLNLAVSWSG